MGSCPGSKVGPKSTLAIWPFIHLLAVLHDLAVQMVEIQVVEIQVVEIEVVEIQVVEMELVEIQVVEIQVVEGTLWDDERWTLVSIMIQMFNGFSWFWEY